VRVKLDRLKELVARRIHWQNQVASLKRMRQWVLSAQDILSGTWAESEAALTNATVAERFDPWWNQLAHSRQTEPYSDQEQECLEHFLQITQSLRPHLIHCYDVVGLPRTNNDMERSIRSLKTRYRRISGRKNWNNYLLRYGRRVAYYDCLVQQEGGETHLEGRLTHVSHQQWRLARAQSHSSPSESLKRWRFRHKRDLYLQTLELRWAQTTSGS
jgi:hypothetical protein